MACFQVIVHVLVAIVALWTMGHWRLVMDRVKKAAGVRGLIRK